MSYATNLVVKKRCDHNYKKHCYNYTAFSGCIYSFDNVQLGVSNNAACNTVAETLSIFSGITNYKYFIISLEFMHIFHYIATAV